MIDSSLCNLSKDTVLVTGGTGSFGKAFIRSFYNEWSSHFPKKLIVFSRDELKQYEMKQELSDMGVLDKLNIRFFIGDVRDRDRLRRAFEDVTIVIHAAALKQLPTCEYNPVEAIKTNINGAVNIIEAAQDTKVKKILAISTDKATSPANLYGATKLVAEKLFVRANAYSGENGPIFSCVRYGNVMGSRGSVIPLFLSQVKKGKFQITNLNMTRFNITLNQAVHFVKNAIDRMKGREVFIPKLPTYKVVDLATAIDDSCELVEIGIRPGEKIHESLFSSTESIMCLNFCRYIVLYPRVATEEMKEIQGGSLFPAGFEYSSDNQENVLSVRELRDLINLYKGEKHESFD